jgi:SAM-dependent methyltransferase
VTAAQLRDVRMAQLERQDWAVTAGGVWSSAETLWPFLTQSTNIVRAAEAMRWDELLSERATVLDLACGSGWLAALLSAQPGVARVLAWDSSPHLLTEVLPAMVPLAGGEPAKIERFCGDFLPLLLDDGAVDAVVMSSAFHHSAEPDALLREIRRVLAPGGPLVLLNETPWHPLGLLAFATRHYLSTVLGLAGLPRPRAVGALTQDGALYDPGLGDRAYTMRGWRRIAHRNGWSLEPRPTGLPSYPATFRKRAFLEPELHHLILRPIAGA